MNGVRKSGVMNSEKCPFSVGETVFYRPTNKGRGAIVMTDLGKLVPDQKYRIARIDEGVYVVPEGFEDTDPGGLYWTEFSAE
jgi:hypothetical protein